MTLMINMNTINFFLPQHKMKPYMFGVLADTACKELLEVLRKRWTLLKKMLSGDYMSCIIITLGLSF